MRSLHTWLVTVVLAVICGGLAGLVVSSGYVWPRVHQLEAFVRERLVQSSANDSKVQVIRVEREPAEPMIPGVFLGARRSPLLPVVKRAARLALDDGLLTNDRLVGSLSAVTVDGWLIGPASLWDGLHVQDTAVVWEGRLYPVSQAIKDTATEVVYVKIEAQNLPVVTPARAEDVVAGLPVWVETWPGRFFPHLIVDVRTRSLRALVRSERVTRRYVVSGLAGMMPKGAAIWNGRGELVGLVEDGDVLETKVIPIMPVLGALASVLTNHEIRHASLGIVGVETGSLVSEAERLPSGFLLGSERLLRGLAAVDPKGPSARVLQAGDIIERLDQDVLDGSADLGERLLSYRPGTTLTLYGRRAGNPLEVRVVLGSVVTSEALK